MNEVNWGHVLTAAQLALQFLLIPIVQKLWAMDVRLVRVETSIDRKVITKCMD